MPGDMHVVGASEQDAKEVQAIQRVVDKILINLFAAGAIASYDEITVAPPDQCRRAIDAAFDVAEAMLAASKARGCAIDVAALFELFGGGSEPSGYGE